jgi:hypothetical protein
MEAGVVRGGKFVGPQAFVAGNGGTEPLTATSSNNRYCFANHSHKTRCVGSGLMFGVCWPIWGVVGEGPAVLVNRFEAMR